MVDPGIGHPVFTFSFSGHHHKWPSVTPLAAGQMMAGPLVSGWEMISGGFHASDVRYDGMMAPAALR